MNKPPLGMFIFVIIIGLSIIIGGVLLSETNKKYSEQTTAIITDIDIRPRPDGKIRRYVYVKYEVNGVEYDGLSNYWDRGMSRGDEIIIHYNPQKPSEFQAEVSAWAILIMSIMGLIFVGIGTGFLISQMKQNKKKKYLLDHGIKITATIRDIVPGNIKVNNRRSSRIISDFTDKSTGASYLFESGNIWVNIPANKNQSKPQTISVYVDPNDYTMYYLDIEEFLLN